MNQDRRQLSEGTLPQWVHVDNSRRMRPPQKRFFWEPLFIMLVYYLRQNGYYHYMCLCYR